MRGVLLLLTLVTAGALPVVPQSGTSSIAARSFVGRKAARRVDVAPRGRPRVPPRDALAVTGGGAPSGALLAVLWRYAAYGSDCAEAIRPLVRLNVVKVLYTLTIFYISLTVWDAGAQAVAAAYHPPAAIARATLHAALFQIFANLLLPTSLVRLLVIQSSRALGGDAPCCGNVLAAAGPTMLGVSLIPWLPALDPFIEHAIDAVYDVVWPAPKIQSSFELCEKARSHL